jgi:hypothetical protein
MESFMLDEFLSRVRRNHALEHATINVLSEKNKGFSAQGNSSQRGFHLNIYGEIEEDQVIEAVEEAYLRLKGGEAELGLHPNCGTVLLTTAAMAAVAAQATFSLEQRRQKRSSANFSVIFGALPTAVLAVVIAIIASRPIGMAIQDRFTVEGDIGTLQVSSIQMINPSPVTRLFQLLLGQANNDHVKAYKIDTIG